jgi:hypothetical protein
MIAPAFEMRSTARSYSAAVRQIWRPVATSSAKVQLPFTTYMTPW